MDLLFEFEILVILLTISLLGIGAYQDYKSREVMDILWISLIIISIPINLIRIFLYWDNLGNVLLIGFISILFGVLFAFFMAFLGIWGGADIFAIICLSLLLPFSVLDPLIPLSFPLNTINSVFPFSLTLIINASLLQIPIPLLIFLKNSVTYIYNSSDYVEPYLSGRFEKIMSSFIAYPEKIETLLLMHPWFYKIMEKWIRNFNISWEDYSIQDPYVRFISEQFLRKKFTQVTYNSSLPRIDFHCEKINKKLSLYVLKELRAFDYSLKLKSPEVDLLEQRRLLIQYAEVDRDSKIWIQPSIPFVTFLFLGVILSLFGGNILFLVLELF